MKKRILTLTFGLFLFVNVSNAATCTQAWQVSQDQIFQDYVVNISDCGSAECEQSVLNTYAMSSIVNNGLWFTCCQIVPWNC